MRKILLAILIIASVLLSGCSNYNNELERLKNENESLKAELAEAKIEIEELKFGAEKLYKEGEEYFNSGQLYEARHAFTLLIKKHPTSKEAEMGKAILSNIEEEIRKKEEAQKITEKEKRESEKSKVQSGAASSSSYEEKRKEFASVIKQALNAPGLPKMCTDAYFNNKGELIIEVNGEWLILEDEIKKDMIYVIKETLRNIKSSLNVEGHGQFFSDSGRPLESFYAD